MKCTFHTWIESNCTVTWELMSLPLSRRDEGEVIKAGPDGGCFWGELGQNPTPEKLMVCFRPIHTFELISFTDEKLWEAGKSRASCAVSPQRVTEFSLWDLCVRIQQAKEAPTPHSKSSSSSRSESSPPSWLTLNTACFEPIQHRLVFASWFKPGDNSLQPEQEGWERRYFIMMEHEHIRLHKCTISWKEAKRSWYYHNNVGNLTHGWKIPDEHPRFWENFCWVPFKKGHKSRQKGRERDLGSVASILYSWKDI